MINKNYRRQDRVSSEIKRFLSELFITHYQEQLKNIAISGVRLAKDYSVADIFILCSDSRGQVYPQDQQKQKVKELSYLLKPIRHDLSQGLDLRRTPRLLFQVDEIYFVQQSLAKIFPEGSVY